MEEVKLSADADAATGKLPEGLTAAEAESLAKEGKINKTNEKVGKSYLKILADNLFTYFNLIWLIVTVLLVILRSYANLTFLLIVLPNVIISTVQEMRAKKTVEKLSVTTEPKASVVRDGALCEIAANEIVLGDVMLIESGRQILSDAVVIEGLAEANESLLTGEADAIKKEAGDVLLAGSFLVSGRVFAKVKSVGRDNYIHKIESAAKNFSAPSSNLFNDLNKLIKGIGIFMIPMAIALFVFNFLVSYKGDPTAAIVKTCGSVIGMIPSGIYLLVTLTLTLSVIKLSRKETLVSDMYSIEMLASADVVCLDKTGTITDGTMSVTDVTILDGTPCDDFARIMAAIEGGEDSINNTSRALIEHFGKDTEHPVLKKIPFSSARKYSALEIEGLGCFSVGAPHFVPCEITGEMERKIEERAGEGERVLVVARHGELCDEGVAIALISIADRIRPNAKETIESFQSQDVTLKVISGDHAKTVSTIAKKVGIRNADKFISCENLSDVELISAAEEYAVFGRVTPEQKVLLIKTLKSNGHIVAMTGDGVNDTLALKESNCAIAMADGSEMARGVSQIVLMNSDFATLPDVVREGRRCINNVRQSATLYLMKTLFVIMLSILSIVTLSGSVFDPKQLLLLEFCVIGLPSVLLALEPNNERIEGSFLETALARSFPDAIALLVPVLSLMIIEKFTPIGVDARNSIAMAVVTLVGFINLLTLCTPYTKWRAAVVGISATLLLVAVPVSILFLGDLFDFLPAFGNMRIFIITLAIGMLISVIMQIFRGKLEKFFASRLRKR